MTFHSILYETEKNIIDDKLEAPGFFKDLNLGQVIDSITEGKKDYNLKPFFYSCFNDKRTIEYRQEIMRDLENEVISGYIKSFAKGISTIRNYISLTKNLEYKYHKEGWFLETVGIYCETVNCLSQNLSSVNLQSKGLSAFCKYIEEYCRSDNFTSVLKETNEIKKELSWIKYCIQIKGCCFKVRKYDSEIDYSVDVENTFIKFKQGNAKDYRISYSFSDTGMNHIEAEILDSVARLYPDIFGRLDDYHKRNTGFFDKTILTFDREIQFFVSVLEYYTGFRQAGLKFCYPVISDTDKEIYSYEGFDIALAAKVLKEKKHVVCNDFYLKDKERIFVTSGPNQGGKTTFARTFGQLHYLASIGCPVPGTKARLFLFDNIHTHFEKEENIKNLRGKLQDDLERIHEILDRATSGSVVIMNEIFTSTTLEDALFLSRKIMEKIIRLDLLCVWVTFIDELSCYSEQTVSMVSAVFPDNPSMRTYKILRRPADGLSYAISIAEKYRLTYKCLKERLGS